MISTGHRTGTAAAALALLLGVPGCFIAMPAGTAIDREQVTATAVGPVQVADNGSARLSLVEEHGDQLSLSLATDYGCFVRHRDTVSRSGVRVNRLESLVGGARAGFAWSILYSAAVGGLAGLALDRDYDNTGYVLLGLAAVPWASLPWAALRARDVDFTETVVSERLKGAACPAPRTLVLIWTTSLSTQYPIGDGGAVSVTLPTPAQLGATGFDLPQPRATLLLDDGSRIDVTLGVDLRATAAAAAWRQRAARPPQPPATGTDQPH